MAEYVTTFTKPYPSGYQDLPSEATPVGHEIIESWETAIVALESYLSENNIPEVSASIPQSQQSGVYIASITINGTQYKIYTPMVRYESSITGGTKVGTLTFGSYSFDVYAPTSSTGGSTVSVVPKTLTGTNIAEITVDGTTYQLYAPTAGSGSGSTVTAEATLTEGTQIGKITIDGKETVLYAPTASTINVDAELSATSENAIQNKVVDAAVKKLQQQIDSGGAGGSITVDSALSTTSENPVQNKAIAEEFQKYANGTKVVAKAAEAEIATTASNAEKINGHTVGTDVPSNAVFTDTVYDDSTVKASIQNIVNGTTQVGSATKATQDAQGNVIDATYAKKTEIPQGSVVDDSLSSTSANPVQNKVVKAEFDKVNGNLKTLKSACTNNAITYSKAVNTTWTNVLYHSNKTINCILSFRLNTIVANTEYGIYDIPSGYQPSIEISKIYLTHMGTKIQVTFRPTNVIVIKPLSNITSNSEIMYINELWIQE